MATIEVYRFNDAVAVSIPGLATVYLAHGEADALARAMVDCAADIRAVKFTSSNLVPTQVAVRDWPNKPAPYMRHKP